MFKTAGRKMCETCEKRPAGSTLRLAEGVSIAVCQECGFSIMDLKLRGVRPSNLRI